MKHVIITKVSKEIFNRLEKPIINTLVFDRIAITTSDICENDVEISLEYDNEFVDTALKVLRLLYEAAQNDQIEVEYDKYSYLISDIKLRKIMIYDADKSISDFGDITNIIYENEANNLSSLRRMAMTPFSGLMVFDTMDYHFMSIPKNIFDWETELPINIEVECENVVIKNRLIDSNFDLKKGSNVIFENCCMVGNMNITSIKNVKFYKCIFLGKVTCIDVGNLYIDSSNIYNLLLYNSNISDFNLVYSKVYRFEWHSCAVKRWDVRRNIISQQYLGNLILPDDKIVAGQFNCKTLKRKYIEGIQGTASEEFLFSFQVKEMEIKGVTSNDILNDTVCILSSKVDYKNDYDTISKLHYKKMLLSNRGIRKFLILITGGFQRPWLWIAYIFILTIAFSLVYSIANVEFSSALEGDKITLDFISALQYSIYNIFGVNPRALTCVGNNQIISAIQTILYTLNFTGFTSSLVNKYFKNHRNDLND